MTSKLEAVLTPREREITALVGQGLSNKEIARLLSCGEATVKAHMHNIFLKLAIHNRTMLAIRESAIEEALAE